MSVFLVTAINRFGTILKKIANSRIFEWRNMQNHHYYDKLEHLYNLLGRELTLVFGLKAKFVQK